MGAIGIRLEDLPLRAQQQALAQLKTAQIQKARKYRNEPEMAEGIRFDSKKEAGRFRELQAMLQAGLIRELRLQQDFTLQEAYTTPDGRRIRAIRYCADFCYERKTQTGWEKIVEDVKSRATRTQKYMRAGRATCDGETAGRCCGRRTSCIESCSGRKETINVRNSEGRGRDCADGSP